MPLMIVMNLLKHTMVALKASSHFPNQNSYFHKFPFASERMIILY